MRRYRCQRLPGLGESVTLDRETSRHMLVACLTPRGESVLLYDEGGLEAEARLEGVDGELARLVVTAEPRELPTTQPLILIQGMPRKPAMERILRMATELGVTEVRPFPAARSVVKGFHEERWGKIVSSSATQCGRGDLPEVRPAKSLKEALEGLPEGERWLLSPHESASGHDETRVRPVALIIGPEGGLTESEVEACIEAGFSGRKIAEWTLRADTAAVAAITLAVQLPTMVAVTQMS